ncbi:MAG TPA: hypothetical protein VOA78_09340 [Candidatus Dormibacteraeota bacterium]|nr:hypothetical protein [Candidatus Dormibacteraeota bacterium]
MKRRRGKRKAKKRKAPRAGRAARADRKGGTEFDEHVKLARKLVKKLRKKVAAMAGRSKASRGRGK